MTETDLSPATCMYFLAQLLQVNTLAPPSDFRPIDNINKQGGKEEVRTWDFRICARLLLRKAFCRWFCPGIWARANARVFARRLG